MAEYEIYQEAVCSIILDFLNRTMEGETVVDEFTERFAKKLALGQEQRCAVKMALAYMDMIHHSFGDWPEGYVGITINLITHVLLKDWDGVEDMLKDNNN